MDEVGEGLAEKSTDADSSSAAHIQVCSWQVWVCAEDLCHLYEDFINENEGQ